jgi:hypothetical protein
MDRGPAPYLFLTRLETQDWEAVLDKVASAAKSESRAWVHAAALIALGRPEEVEGQTVVVIELTLEAEGILPERQRGGRRGGDRATGLATTYTVFETEAAVEFKGQLTWDPKAKRAISLELEGEFTVDMQSSRDTERGLFETWRTTEGDINININYTEEAL